MAERNTKFSLRLRQSIEQAGFTQKKLADVVGVRPVSITKYTKHGGVPEWNILVKIAQSLNVTIDYLLTGTEPALNEVSDHQGCIDLPQADPRPIGATEKRYLEKALEILRAAGCRGQPDQALINSIDSLYTLVEMQGEAVSKPGGERATTGKRNRTGSKGA